MNTEQREQGIADRVEASFAEHESDGGGPGFYGYVDEGAVRELLAAFRAAEARVEAAEEALRELLLVAPAPPFFNTDTPVYVAALAAARAVLAPSQQEEK